MAYRTDGKGEWGDGLAVWFCVRGCFFFFFFNFIGVGLALQAVGNVFVEFL